MVDFDGYVILVPLTGPDVSHEYSTKVPYEGVWGPQEEPHCAA